MLIDAIYSKTTCDYKTLHGYECMLCEHIEYLGSK